MIKLASLIAEGKPPKQKPKGGKKPKVRT